MSDRKYRQRGYRDSDRDDRPQRRGKQGQRPQREGPRGRGLGSPTTTRFRCAVCGFIQGPPGQTEFTVVCKKCETDLHTCTHCIHFDRSSPFECRQEIPERISRKAARNECELYQPKQVQEFGGEPMRPEEARAAFDALFDS